MMFEISNYLIEDELFQYLNKHNIINVKEIGSTIIVSGDPDSYINRENCTLQDLLRRWKAVEITENQIKKRRELYKNLHERALQPFGMRLLYNE